MTEMDEIAFLLAGSNLGEREKTLQAAAAGMNGAGILLRRTSSIYETEPVGDRNQDWFLNVVWEIETTLPPEELLSRCLCLEEAFGRQRPYAGAPRTLDLDILLYGDRIIRRSGLEIPHPRMAQRRFVLEPLAELAPDLVHPVLLKTIQSLRAECPDQSTVRAYDLEEGI